MHTGRQRALVRWTLTAVVAFMTEGVAVFIIFCVTNISDFKFDVVIGAIRKVVGGLGMAEIVDRR
jgi:hypothetical protein